MARIVAEQYAPVYRFCARRIGGELAKDAAQETFLTAQRILKRFNGTCTLLTFLLGIANNQCRNMARKNRMEMSFSEVWEGSSESSERSVIDRETLRQALKALTPDHREVVVMHELEGLTYEEIATILAIPAGTVKSRLHNAFIQLRQKLIPAEEVPA
jgi:RNA polymerase sigma-70 factor, ECF subfamily